MIWLLFVNVCLSASFVFHFSVNKIGTPDKQFKVHWMSSWLSTGSLKIPAAASHTPHSSSSSRTCWHQLNPWQTTIMCIKHFHAFFLPFPCTLLATFYHFQTSQEAYLIRFFCKPSHWGRMSQTKVTSLKPCSVLRHVLSWKHAHLAFLKLKY